MNKETQIAKREPAGALATNLFEADANAGGENISQEDLALPFLKVLGQLSPEINKVHAKYIEGAEPGMLLNTVTKKLYDGAKGIEVIPCHYKLEYQEWADYGTGSNRPENIYADNSDILSKTTKDGSGKDRLENGNYIQTTGQHYVLIVGDDGTEQALVSMSSSQGKVSRKWNSMMMSISLDGKNGSYTPPSFSHSYKLTTVLNSGKGNQWYGYNVSKIGPVKDEALYKHAKKFYTSLASK